jgi:hypothetical protein
LLARVSDVVQFNQSHRKERFDGIHLDIEPQQRPENKGPGNLRFLPDLAEVFGQVRAQAASAGMTVNADIQMKLLKGDARQRQMLLSAVPRVTLMMYELSRPDDGQSPAEKANKAAETSQRFLTLAYADLGDRDLARMAIALRTPDYGELLPTIFERLDAANQQNTHYLGWARHSYNDTLEVR